MKNNYFLNTYKRLNINIIKGKGVYLFDDKGNRYLDFFSGLAVNALGYAHPKIVEAVSKQISEFAHLSNYFVTDVQTRFAEKLLNYSQMDKLFLTNSGTEAVEAAVKLIRKKYGPDKIIYSFSNSFHGRTYGALSLTARTQYREGFEPLLSNIHTIKFNDIRDLKDNINNNTAAVFIELIQGEGGINEASVEFVNELLSLRAKYGFIIAADEIQSGTGRTGKAFAYDHYNFKPDIGLAAKAIGGGLPLGAMLVDKKLENVFSQGSHGTTFGGNPVSCVAGKVVLEEIFENGLLENVFSLGNYFKEQLVIVQKKYPDKINEVRGKGFMLGVALKFPGKPVADEMLNRKILINCTNENVIRLLPPLIINKEHIDLFLKEFEDVVGSIG